MRAPWPVLLTVAAGGALAWLLWPSSTAAGESLVPTGPAPRPAPEPGTGAAPVPASVSPGWTWVTWSEGGHTVSLAVADDYLAPMPVLQAQPALDELEAIFPTRKIVEKVHAAAPVKLPFRAMNPDVEGVGRASAEMIRRHQALTERDRAGRAGLASGHQKDYVLAKTMPAGKCVIYGGRYASGALVQPLSSIHGASYFDYSHGTRAVSKWATLDGREASLEDILRDPAVAGIVSDEGTLSRTRYT